MHKEVWTDLHSDKSVVDKDFFGQEVRANGGFVTGTEFLVDLCYACALAFMGVYCEDPSVRRTYWFIKLVFPTPLSPRMITWRASD